MKFLFDKLSFSDWTITTIWIFFSIATLFVIVSSIIIPRIVVNLLKKKNISPIFMGVFFLSILTSVPEILSVYFFSFQGGQGVKEAFSNVWGANFLSIAVICLLDFFYVRYLFFKQTSHSLKKTAFFVCFLNLIFFSIVIFPDIFNYFKILNINLLTIFIILIYLLFLIYFELKFRGQKNKSKSFVTIEIDYFNYKKNNVILFLLFLIFAFFMIFSMIFIISISGEIKNYYELKEETIGGLLFASLTSSPEIWSAISFFQLGLGLAAVGTILGSHLFNVVIFVSVDFFLPKQLISYINKEEGIFLFFVFLNSLLLFINIIRPISHKKQDYLFFPFLIIVIFILGWVLMLLN